MILVTGAKGMVGSAVCNELKRKNLIFVGVGRKDFDLRNDHEVIAMFNKYEPKYLIHCAAVVGGVKFNREFPHILFRDNILINTNVIHQAHRFMVKKTIAFSSACAFRDNQGTSLFKEEELQNGKPYVGNLGYGYAKRMVDIQISICNEITGRKNITLIPTSVYGPEDNFDLSNSHFVAGLIYKTYLARQNKTPLELWGTGEPLREMLFSKDLAKVIVELLEKDAPDKLIVPGEEVSILDAAKAITEIMGLETEIKLDKTKPDGQYRKATDRTRFNSVMSDFKFTPYKEGLKQTVDWFLERKNNNLSIRE